MPGTMNLSCCPVPRWWEAGRRQAWSGGTPAEEHKVGRTGPCPVGSGMVVSTCPQQRTAASLPAWVGWWLAGSLQVVLEAGVLLGAG